jgi:hypothetical protein
MNKKDIFMIWTAITSFIEFNFNKILDFVLSLIFHHMKDSSVHSFSRCGLYSNSMPITANLVMIDGENFTNKFNLLMSWKWDFNMKGISTDNLEMLKENPKGVTLSYMYKYGNLGYSTVYINLLDETITDDKEIKKDILFGEIELF